MVTIGVVIPVPDPFGSMLQNKRAGFGDPLAEHIPSHVTLVPPMEVADTDLQEVCGLLERASVMLLPFPMRLRGTGTFRPVSQVVFVAVSQGISYTEMLAKGIREALDAPEPQFPYHPHVTIAQDLDDVSLDRAYDELRDFECQFDVDEFALYQHEESTGWLPQRTFTLGAE